MFVLIKIEESKDSSIFYKNFLVWRFFEAEPLRMTIGRDSSVAALLQNDNRKNVLDNYNNTVIPNEMRNLFKGFRHQKN